jgi:ABC-type phosphate transport system permease subunit
MTARKVSHKTIIVGLAIALVFVLVGVFLFSYSMETLDKQAEQLGATENPIYDPPFKDYNIPGLDNVWGALLVGVVSTLLLFAIAFGVAKIMQKKSERL